MDDNDRFPDSGPLFEIAHAAVEAELKQLNSIPYVDPFPKHSAALAAWSARETAAKLSMASELLAIQIKRSAITLDAAQDRLSATIKDFTEKADAGTNRLAFWTMALAIVTLLLVGAAAAQAWVTWSAQPQVVVVQSPKP